MSGKKQVVLVGQFLISIKDLVFQILLTNLKSNIIEKILEWKGASLI